jgi:hypothetical protein
MKNLSIRLLILTNIVLLIVAAAPKQSKVLTASQIDIVDSKGVVRARIAGNLPETFSNGKAIGRGAAGILLYDAAGLERGGYVTFANDHVALTLDSKKEMTGIFVAGPTGSAALTLRDAGQVIDVRADSDDGPTIHVLRDNKVLFHQPPAVNFEKGAGCAEFRGMLAKRSREELLTLCRQRMSEEGCQACLGSQ